MNVNREVFILRWAWWEHCSN